MEHDWDRNPFRIPELWKATLPLPIPLKESRDTLFQPLDFHLPSLSQLALADQGHVHTIKYQDLEDFHGTVPPLDIEPLKDLPTPSKPETGTQDDRISSEDEDELDGSNDADFWTSTAREPPFSTYRFLTWEDFNKEHPSPRSSPIALAYISESGPAVFDHALHLQSAKSASGRVVQTDILLNSLIQLSLGRTSVLFPWDEDKRKFSKRIDDARLTGVTFETSQSIIQQAMTLGKITRRLRLFIERAYSMESTSSARTALANAVENILNAIEETIIDAKHTLRSVLQLEFLVVKPAELLDFVARTVDRARVCKHEHEVVDAIYNICSVQMDSTSTLAPLAQSLLAIVAAPVLDSIAFSVGILSSSSTSTSSIPNCFSEQVRGLIHEIQSAKQYLESNEIALTTAFDCHLSWAFSWEALNHMDEQAKQAQQGIFNSRRAADQQPDEYKSRSFSDAWNMRTTFEEPLSFAILQCDHKPQHEVQDDQSVHHQARLYLDSATFNHLQPPLDVTLSLSITPLLSIQSRMLSHKTMHAILHQFQLRSHLDLQAAFSLCRSGLFVSSLQHILFSPDVESAERKKGSYRTGHDMGLNLERRTEWPPASSELRLALMNIISDTSTAESLLGGDVSRHQNTTSLISFGVRQIESEEEIAKVLNPQSIHALDFLCITHNPPPALEPVFTSTAVDNYDRIFMLLLRLMRIQFTISQLHRDIKIFSASAAWKSSFLITRFRHRATFFFDTLTTYFLQSGVEKPWRDLMNIILKAEQDYLQPQPSPGIRGPQNNIANLTNLVEIHEKALKRISSNLLLRSKQKAASTALQDVCTSVLDYAGLVRASGSEGPDNMRLKVSCADFEEKIERFIDVCRNLAAAADQDDQDEHSGGGARAIVEALGADL